MKRTQALRPQTGPQEVSLLQAHLTVSRLFVLHTPLLASPPSWTEANSFPPGVFR